MRVSQCSLSVLCCFSSYLTYSESPACSFLLFSNSSKRLRSSCFDSSFFLAFGFKVLLTRNWDSSVKLPERSSIAKRQKADLFVSLHFNGTASGQNEARGAETYAMTPAGGSSTAGNGSIRGNSYSGNRFNDSNLLLAYQIQKSLVARLGVEDRGVRRARFEVLRDATMPAVLVEGGFLSHPAESKKIFDAAYRREMAKAILEGIQTYKRAVE